MASKKTFKPPVKKTDFPRKPTVSLTDDQYEEIFNAVLHSSQKAVDVKSPTMADVPRNIAKSPKESASVENSQSSQPDKPLPKPAKNADTSTMSTINSEEFIRNAKSSTPIIIKNPNTYREAIKSLKEKLKTTASISNTESLDNSVVELIDDEPLSQPPSHLSRREKLQWLQDRRGTGLYVKCDDPKCEKWRWLDIADPVDVPHEWFCRMNPDKAFASCSIPEKVIPMRVEDDLIHNCYTAGSIVWAKLPGYPWWPAMVDDCPDCEQYYWINNELYDVPNWYHVVFFDAKEVTRHWMLVKDIKSFKHSPNFDVKFKTKQCYKKRLAVAKQKANAALKLHVKDRLKEYSFLSLWKGDIPEFNDSDIEDSDLNENDSNYDRIIKKKVIQRRKALLLSQESSNKKLIEETDSNISSQESNETAISSSVGVQTRRMSQNSRRNSETEMDFDINKPKKTVKKSKTEANKIILGKNTKAKKDNNKVVARRSTLATNENLNKSAPIFESKKIDLPRRKSENILKEREGQNMNPVNVEFIQQLTNRCNDLIKIGKMESKKYEKIFKEDKNESSFSPKKIENTPNKKQSKFSASLNNFEASSNEGGNPKRRKINDEGIASTKTDTVIKKKKSFMPPVKKTTSLNTSSSNVSSSNIHSPLFEE